MRRTALEKLRRLRGHKILVQGNHDKENAAFYLEYFDDVRAIYFTKGVVFTHVPIHPGSLSRWIANVHGHTHDRVVLRDDGQPDSRYVCVSVEQQGFAPRTFADILDQARGGAEYYRRQYGRGPLDTHIDSGAG